MRASQGRLRAMKIDAKSISISLKPKRGQFGLIKMHISRLRPPFGMVISHTIVVWDGFRGSSWDAEGMSNVDFKVFLTKALSKHKGAISAPPFSEFPSPQAPPGSPPNPRLTAPRWMERRIQNRLAAHHSCKEAFEGIFDGFWFFPSGQK